MPQPVNIPRFQPLHSQNKARIKTRFVSGVLSETAVEIRNNQMEVVNDWNLFASGELKKMLQGHFSVDSISEGAKLNMSYLVYARFLDLGDKRRRLKKEGYSLYNRIVYGILYNKALPELKYGFTKDVQQIIAANIDAAMTGDRFAQAAIAKKLREGYF